MGYDRTAPRQKKDRVRITDTFVKTDLAPGVYVDASDPPFGFQLKVTEAGRKVYRVYGKVKGHKSAITVTIGHHGQPSPDGGKWTAKKAETEALKIFAKMKDGTDPNVEQDKEVAANQQHREQKEELRKTKALTLQKAFDDYLANKRTKHGPLKESTKYVYACEFKSCLRDWLDRPMKDIENAEKDVEDRHKRISREEPGSANHVMRILRAVFNFAMNESGDDYRIGKQQIITSNPVKAFSKKHGWNKLAEKKIVIKDYQFGALFQAFRHLDHPIATDIFQMLALTGLRTEEAASLPWKEVYWKERAIRIAETKNHKEHWLPLTDYLYAMLKARKNNGSRYVFGTGPDTYMSDFRTHAHKVVQNCKQVLAASDDEDVAATAEEFAFRIKDLRKTFETVAARLLPGYVAKQLLNHRDSSDVTQTHYIHIDIENLREPMRVVNDHILTCAGVTEYGAASPAPRTKVVPIKQAQARKQSTKR
jgi:integrase